MTKLEQKLIELGYLEIERGHYFNGLVNFTLTYDKTKLVDGWVKPCAMRHEYELTYNIEAFNQLQNDLKELKEYD